MYSLSKHVRGRATPTAKRLVGVVASAQASASHRAFSAEATAEAPDSTTQIDNTGFERPPQPLESYQKVPRGHRPLRLTSPGTQGPSPVAQLYEDDPYYTAYKELTGYNSFIQAKHLSNPRLPEHPNLWDRQYFRDEKGEATLPARFKDIDMERFGRFLEKADHYFFAQNIAPKLQTYMPFEQPKDTVVDTFFETSETSAVETEKVRRLREAFDKEVKKYEAFDAVPSLFPHDPEVVRNTLSEDQTVRVGDADRMRSFLTAQQRRAEFWTKFSAMMGYSDAMYDQVVRCTLATGRVPSFCSLVIMGNKNGVITYGRGKAPNAGMATRRAIFKCRRNVLFVPLHEHRTIFQTVVAKWKCTRVLVKPQARGFGIHASPAFFSLLTAIGVQDGTVRRIGSHNIWNGVRAFFEAMRMQRSFRDLALSRGAHFQVMMNPFFKNPPVPTADEIKDLEKDAAAAFTEAIKDVVRNRDLLLTPAYMELTPHFEEGHQQKAIMDSIFDAKKVPESMRIYPPFTEFLDFMSGASPTSDPYDALKRAVEVTTKPVTPLEMLRARGAPDAADPTNINSDEDIMGTLGPDDFEATRRWFAAQEAIVAGFTAHQRPVAELSSDEEARPAGQRGFKHIPKPDVFDVADAEVYLDYKDSLETIPDPSVMDTDDEPLNPGLTAADIAEAEMDPDYEAERFIGERVERLLTLVDAKITQLARASPADVESSGLADATVSYEEEEVDEDVEDTLAFLSKTSARDVEKIVNHELADVPHSRKIAERLTALLSAPSFSEAISRVDALESMDPEFRYFPADSTQETLLERTAGALERVVVEPYLTRAALLSGHKRPDNYDYKLVTSENPLDNDHEPFYTVSPGYFSRARAYRRAARRSYEKVDRAATVNAAGDLLEAAAKVPIRETQMHAAVRAAGSVADVRNLLRGVRVEAAEVDSEAEAAAAAAAATLEVQRIAIEAAAKQHGSLHKDLSALRRNKQGRKGQRSDL